MSPSCLFGWISNERHDKAASKAGGCSIVCWKAGCQDASNVESWQVCLPQGHRVKDQRKMKQVEKLVLTFSDEPYPGWNFQLQLSSVCVCVRAVYTSVFMVLWLCHCVWGIVCITTQSGSQQDPGSGIPAHHNLTKGTDGFLWRVLSA